MLNDSNTVDRLAGNPPLVSTDKETLIHLAGWTHYTIANRVSTNQAKENLLTKGKELIALIKSKYQLE